MKLVYLQDKMENSPVITSYNSIMLLHQIQILQNN